MAQRCENYIRVVILLYYNAWTNVGKAVEKYTMKGFYSPDLSACGFNIFELLKMRL